MKFFWQRDDLAGVDDAIAEQALAKRAQLRQGAPSNWWCRRRFRHPRVAIQFEERQFLTDGQVRVRPANGPTTATACASMGMTAGSSTMLHGRLGGTP